MKLQLTLTLLALALVVCLMTGRSVAADDDQDESPGNSASTWQDQAQSTVAPTTTSTTTTTTTTKPKKVKGNLSKLLGVATTSNNLGANTCPKGCACEETPKKLSCTGEQIKNFPDLTASPGWVWIEMKNTGMENVDLNQLNPVQSTLERLDLSRNMIKTFSMPSKKLMGDNPFGKLNMLTVSENKMQNISRLAAWQLRSLETLDISSNPLVELGQFDFNNTKSLQVLNLQNLKLKSIHELAFSKLGELKSLNMSGTKIENHLGDKQFVANQELETVDLTDNGLIEVPFALRSTNSITRLILNANNMTSLRQSDFINQTKLTDLEIKRCSKLTKIDDLTFGELTSLRKIILADNPVLNSISKDAFKPSSDTASTANHTLDIFDIRNNNLTTLSNPLEFTHVTFKQLLLSGNPWHCDCNLKWYNQLPVQSKPLAHCKSPAKYEHIEIGESLSTIDCEIVDSILRTVIVTGFLLFLLILLVLVIVQKSEICRRFLWRDQYGTIYYTKASFPPETM